MVRNRALEEISGQEGWLAPLFDGRGQAALPDLFFSLSFLYPTVKGAAGLLACRTLRTALLLAHLFVGGDLFNPDTAVCRHCLDGWPSRAEIHCNLLRNLALNSHREIHVDTSVNRSGLQIRRVILRH